MTKVIVCSACKCSLTNCNDNDLLNDSINCKNCIKEICCCIDIHKNKLQTISSSFPSNFPLKSKSKLFFIITKDMYPAARRIEILCIMAAEIGENIGLYTFGFNLFGITLSDNFFYLSKQSVLIGTCQSIH